ncbi:MAG: M20/M25/M40 family metallo-hydrolase [Terriglobales bacterium]
MLVEMVDLLRAWVEHESPSLEPERARALAARVAEAFVAEGCRATPHAAALQLDYPGGEAAPVLVLGHLDTVYPAGTLVGAGPSALTPRRGDSPPRARLAAAMPFRVDEAHAYGPGVYDMKGGIVAALFALRQLRARQAAHPPVTFLWVFDEETGSHASRAVTERLAQSAQAALVLEPGAEPDGALKLARKGIALYTLAAHGVAAHAGLNFEAGASAIAELAVRVAEITSWADSGRGLTVNCGLIRGGSRVNVVAAEAAADFEVRAWERTTLESVDHRLRQLKPSNPKVRLELTGGINRPPMEPSAASERLAALAEQSAAQLGLTLGRARTGGGSDGNFTAALGVPTLDGLGMVGGGAHSPTEHIRLDCLEPRAALLASLLQSLA